MPDEMSNLPPCDIASLERDHACFERPGTDPREPAPALPLQRGG